MANLKLLAVKVTGPDVPTLNGQFGPVEYSSEPYPTKGVYITLSRPSYKDSVSYPPSAGGMKILAMPGLPFDAKFAVEFCGEGVERFVDQVNHLTHADGIPRVVAPILRQVVQQHFKLIPGR